MTTYTGRVWIDHWHDGDTFYGVIDTGYNQTIGNEVTTFARIRIQGTPPKSGLIFDAPELGDVHVITDDNRAGHDALDYAETIAPPQRFYDYVGHKFDTYGRPLLDFLVPVLQAPGVVGGTQLFTRAMLAAGCATWRKM